jgi:hypothetical protein
VAARLEVKVNANEIKVVKEFAAVTDEFHEGLLAWLDEEREDERMMIERWRKARTAIAELVGEASK